MQPEDLFEIYSNRIQTFSSFVEFMTLVKEEKSGIHVCARTIKAMHILAEDIDSFMPDKPIILRHLALVHALKLNPASHPLTRSQLSVYLKCLGHIAAGDYAEAVLVVKNNLGGHQAAESVRVHKQFTEEIAKEHLAKLDVRPPDIHHQIGLALWQLLPDMSRLPRLHTLSLDPFTVAAAQAKLDDWMKVAIVPQIDYEALHYMTNLWPYFAILPDESTLSILARIESTTAMIKWAHTRKCHCTRMHHQMQRRSN